MKRGNRVWLRSAATTQQSIVIVVIRMVQPFRMKTLNTAQNGTERSVTYAYYILMITRGEYRGTFYIGNTALTGLYLTIHKTTRRNENDSR